MTGRLCPSSTPDRTSSPTNLSSGELRRLAGAKAFVVTGFTSGGLGDPTSGTAQSLACDGSSGFADLQAKAETNQNGIAGTAPTTVTTTCDLSIPENPRITVTVARTELPTFFSRIWACRK